MSPPHSHGIPVVAAQAKWDSTAEVPKLFSEVPKAAVRSVSVAPQSEHASLYRKHGLTEPSQAASLCRNDCVSNESKQVKTRRTDIAKLNPVPAGDAFPHSNCRQLFPENSFQAHQKNVLSQHTIA